MIQLAILPPEKKIRISQLERSKTITRYVVFIGVCLFLATGAVVVTNLLLNRQLESENERLASLTAGGKQVSLTAVTETVTRRLQVLQDFTSASQSPVAITNEVLRLLPEGISLDRFEALGTERRLVLEGIARDRSTYLDLRDRLEEQPFVVSVQTPISSLAKPTDIPFTMQVSLTPVE